MCYRTHGLLLFKKKKWFKKTYASAAWASLFWIINTLAVYSKINSKYIPSVLSAFSVFPVWAQWFPTTPWGRYYYQYYPPQFIHVGTMTFSSSANNFPKVYMLMWGGGRACTYTKAVWFQYLQLFIKHKEKLRQQEVRLKALRVFPVKVLLLASFRINHLMSLIQHLSAKGKVRLNSSSDVILWWLMWPTKI